MNVYWLITLLPKFVIGLLVLAGVVGFLATILLGKLPLIKQYKLIVQIASALLFVSGIYLTGALGYKEATDKAVNDLRIKLAKAEAKSATVNTQVVEKVVTQQKIIRQRGDDIIRYVDHEVVKYDNTCKLPKEVIDAHNMAASLDPNAAPKQEDKK